MLEVQGQGELCFALGALLRDLARAQVKGMISEESFVEMVLLIEAEQARPRGLTLTASDTEDNWTVVRIAGKGGDSSSFEFSPAVGEIREVIFE